MKGLAKLKILFIAIMSLLVLAVYSPTPASAFSSTSNKTTQSMIKVPMGLATLLIPKNKWSYGISKQIFDQPIPLFQHKKFTKLFGNMQSTLKITPAKEIFQAQSTMKHECNQMKEIYGDMIIENFTFKVIDRLENKNFPSCWVMRDNSMGSKVTILFVTKRKGKTATFSYLLHTLTFNFPTSVKSKVMSDLAAFVSGAHYLPK